METDQHVEQADSETVLKAIREGCKPTVEFSTPVVVSSTLHVHTLAKIWCHAFLDFFFPWQIMNLSAWGPALAFVMELNLV